MKRAFKMIAFQALMIAGSGAAMTAVAYQSNAATAPSADVIHIGNFTFSQSVLTVHPGTRVTWINDDDIPHTIVAKDMTFKSRVLDTGDRFTFTFAKAGQFDYFCSIHPHMTGKVIVKA
jgi:plastocyanin